MTKFASDVIRKLARRVHEDPTSATVDDAKKLARALILLTEGKLP